MTRRRVIITGVALLATAAAMQAQTPAKTEKVKGTTQYHRRPDDRRGGMGSGQHARRQNAAEWPLPASSTCSRVANS